jgi:hypothetical protein
VTRRRATVLGAAVAPLLLAGCVTVNVGTPTVACSEGDDGEPANGVILMAQSVPTASFVPCLDALPVGWHFIDLDARNDVASFWLDSDRYGDKAITVRLTASCDTGNATTVGSERPDMSRLQEITQINPTFAGRLFYVFDGGCMTIDLKLSGSDSAEALAVATQGLDVVPREELQDQVREETGGRLELDPPGEGAR